MRHRRARSLVRELVPAPLVLATRSAGKIRELTALCAHAGIAVQTLDALGIAERADEEGIEAFDTFEANAEAKARWFAALLPGRVVLAEDSGLEVDALGGAPGVWSKRWAGSDATGAALDAANNAALVSALAPHASRDARRARYRCVAVCVIGAQRWSGAGAVEGVITTAARGHGGFGYDPWFESTELGVTFGEASPAEKSRVSHRARAVRAVLAAGGAALRSAVQRTR
jgi:XTP/dITP diphosphohydrolase